MHVGDADASALAAALGQGALPRLKTLYLDHAAIGDAGLVALAPALRRRARCTILETICGAFHVAPKTKHAHGKGNPAQPIVTTSHDAI